MESDTRDVISRCVFRLRSNAIGRNLWEWGTGFFVAPKVALTAWHNIPQRLRAAGQLKAVYLDPDGREHEIKFSWDRSASSACHDVAVLRLLTNSMVVSHLKPAFLPARLSLTDMQRHWWGRQVAIYGFPFNQHGNAGRLLIGSFHTGQPVEQFQCSDPEGAILKDPATGKSAWTLRLRVFADNAYELSGISGAPIVDVESGYVVGVEHSYLKHQRGEDTSARFVYGTPLCRLAGLWPAALLEECGITVIDVNPPEMHRRKQSRRTYLTKLFESTDSMDIRGLSVGTGKAYRFKIDELYVTLRSSSTDLQKGSISVPLQQLLIKPGRVILGDPGSGKTTFLKWVAHALAEAQLASEGSGGKTTLNRMASEERLGIKESVFPIHIELADFSDFIGIRRGTANAPWAYDSPTWLVHYLAQQSEDRNWELDDAFFKHQLMGNPVLLLMDGLDEVPNHQQRENLGRLIENIQRGYPSCTIVVTSRPGIEEREQILGAWPHARIEPLDDDGVQAFLRSWCDALCGDNRTDFARHLRKLTLVIGRNFELRRMARNPVMLTAVALLYWNERTLPEQRAELYESVIMWLARSREQRRNRPGPDRCIEHLQELALAMQSDEDGRQVQVSHRRAAEWLSGRFSDGIEGAEAFLRDEQEDSGIIVGRGNQLRFWHLTFQEFLAARAIARKVESDRRQILSSSDRLHSPEWREVVLLHAGVLHKIGPDQVELFFRDVLDRVDPSKKAFGLGRLLSVFGYESLAERAKCAGLLGAVLRDLHAAEFVPADPRFEKLLQSLRAVFELHENPNSKSLSIQDRIEAADAMPQPGNPMLHPWVSVPAGRFWMGAQHHDKSGRNYDVRAEGNESPVHEVSVNGFEMGRYPVAVVEFGKFMTDRGYTRKEFWVAGGFGKFREPEGWDVQISYPNRAVVGVSWFEAAAYCAFHGYRLPTEAEWEWAARGAEGRRYPWGNQDPNSTRLNYEGSVRQVTPVGVYPAGATPEGIFNMAGNVWEWCRDWYARYTEEVQSNPVGAATGPNRVLRGGSWNDSFVRAATRIRYPPEWRSMNAGFRVVWDGVQK